MSIALTNLKVDIPITLVSLYLRGQTTVSSHLVVISSDYPLWPFNHA